MVQRLDIRRLGRLKRVINTGLPGLIWLVLLQHPYPPVAYEMKPFLTGKSPVFFSYSVPLLQVGASCHMFLNSIIAFLTMRDEPQFFKSSYQWSNHLHTNSQLTRLTQTTKILLWQQKQNKQKNWCHISSRFLIKNESCDDCWQMLFRILMMIIDILK